MQLDVCKLVFWVGDGGTGAPALVRRLVETWDEGAVFRGEHPEPARRPILAASAEPAVTGHPDRDVRYWATCAFQALEDAAARALLRVLESSDEGPEVRGQAADNLSTAVPEGEQRRFVPHLVHALSGQAPEVRFWACHASQEPGSKRHVAALGRAAG